MDYKEKLISLINDKTLPIEQRKKLEEIYNSCVESEDERIRKGILNYLTMMWGNSQDDICGVNVEDAIAWLEKQGEKVQIEEIRGNQGKISPKWSEEDERMLSNIIEDFGNGKTSNMLQEKWLKSLKQRMEE